jgi:outer membrane protein
MNLLQKGAMVATMMLASVSVFAEGTKIAFINTTQVVELIPQAQTVRETLQKEFAPTDNELSAKQKKIVDMDEMLKRDGAIMSATEKRKLEREIQLLKEAFISEREAFSKTLTQRRNEELKKMQQQIAQVVVEIAQEQGYDMVIESGVVFAVTEVNISRQVIERLQKQHNDSTPPLQLKE